MESGAAGYNENVTVELVAVLVLVLMAADILRMLFADDEPRRHPVRRRNS